MSAIVITELYEILASQFGKEDAKKFINCIKQDMKAEMENNSKILATKDDLSKVRFELIMWILGSWITLAALIIGLHFAS